jgi:transglutaminase-like putative cysteine protease
MTRIRVRHTTTYSYERPTDALIQVLRVTPGDHQGQKVLSWRIDVDVDGRLRRGHDPFGNILHLFYADDGVHELTVRVTGEVDVRETAGVIEGAVEPLRPSLFLRTTRLTALDPSLVAWASASPLGPPLARLHLLAADLRSRMRFDTRATGVETNAAQAFALAHGVCQDFTHIFIAAARSMGIPARYVSGHLARPEADEQEASHAWAEAYIPDLGWTGFDPTNGVSPDDNYIRVAVGLDYLDAAPVRGARRGGGREGLHVAVRATHLAQSSTDG